MAKSMRSKTKRSFRRTKREAGVFAAADAARLERLSKKLADKVVADKDGDAPMEEEEGEGEVEAGEGEPVWKICQAVERICEGVVMMHKGSKMKREGFEMLREALARRDEDEDEEAGVEVGVEMEMDELDESPVSEGGVDSQDEDDPEEVEEYEAQGESGDVEVYEDGDELVAGVPIGRLCGVIGMMDVDALGEGKFVMMDWEGS